MGLLHETTGIVRFRVLKLVMLRKSPFKHHRFPNDIIRCTVRWYLRYPLSNQDVVDLPAERGFTVDRSTIYRWVQKFSLEFMKRTEKHLRRASVDWQLDETYVCVGGKWRYLSRAVDANGQMVDFRLTARRDEKAAKAFLNTAIERVRLHRPVTICSDKAHAYRRGVRETNHRHDLHFDSIRHVDQKWRNNLIESDHAALSRLLGYRQSFRSLRSAKATLCGIETMRTIKSDRIHNKEPGILGEIQFISQPLESVRQSHRKQQTQLAAGVTQKMPKHHSGVSPRKMINGAIQTGQPASSCRSVFILSTLSETEMVGFVRVHSQRLA